jgi:hypothetical protein
VCVCVGGSLLAEDLLVSQEGVLLHGVQLFSDVFGSDILCLYIKDTGLLNLS